jgi:hypothetical protein
MHKWDFAQQAEDPDSKNEASQRAAKGRTPVSEKMPYGPDLSVD